jgi:hypothetical protein
MKIIPDTLVANMVRLLGLDAGDEIARHFLAACLEEQYHRGRSDALHEIRGQVARVEGDWR